MIFLSYRESSNKLYWECGKEQKQKKEERKKTIISKRESANGTITPTRGAFLHVGRPLFCQYFSHYFRASFVQLSNY